MRRDPTEFRERFQRWRDTGESQYDAGRIRKYEDGKDAINYETLKSHSYRVPFIEDKAVRLTNAGLATGAVLSTNLLDSIADNAYVAGLPIKTALGLVTKESTLGNPTDDTSVYKILSPQNVAKFKKWGTGQNINNGMSVEEQTLVNYYKGDTDYELFNGRGNPENRQSILKTAFQFYKNHPNKYNPGQKNHTDLVQRRGEEVWDSPEVKKWYSEYKINKLINAINNSDTHKTLKNVFPKQNEYYYSQPQKEGWKRDLEQPLSPVDPVGEFVVGNAALGPVLKYLNPIKRVPKSTYIKPTTQYENVPKLKLKSNNDYIMEAVPTNRAEAYSYVTSDGRKKAFSDLIQNAHKEGYIKHPEYFESTGPYIETEFPKIKIEPLEYGTKGSYTRHGHVVKIDPYQSTKFDDTVYHEHLHAGGVAQDSFEFRALDNPLYQQAQDNIINNVDVLENANLVKRIGEDYRGLERYYKDLAAKVLKRDPSRYISYPRETAANAMEFGRNIGIKPFDPQPSNEEIIKMLVGRSQSQNAFAQEMKTPITNEDFRLIWKAMNGTLLPSIAIPVVYNKTK